ncbi:TOMM precursor leader peptide-binding protein [Streptosporangium sandarakinum]|uniref:Bacteriocin biosynthesis cyclodehydratase domain-containing protein n=1 Tax=Streptosporangium sandarakinum TaxID=1260955 RepID=A0A852USB5_9ACTN|nr:TOMM precursor leader peptide-binding protein [Streptosporangium sandarakinum]NYF40092.1 bacteriocin biosynthesis cyclodehydratase domain-containing protein [Streptosporangium sandarakinum]
MHELHMITLGGFGAAVAGRVRELRDGVAVTPADEHGHLDPSLWPAARVRVLASFRPAPRLEETLDGASFAYRTPWFPVVLEHPRLRVGPVAAPGHGACARCFATRRRQHDPTHHLGAVLAGAYDADPALGPGGHLPHHTELAALLTVRLTDSLLADGGAAEAGHVRHVHLLDGTLGRSTVVGVHGCRRCRSTPDQRESTWRDLADELPELLAPAAGH